MKCAPPFSLQGFRLFWVTYPHTVVLETLIDNVKLNFFYLSVLRNYYAYTYSFFDKISHTFWEKTAIHSCLVCFLRSLLLSTSSVIVQTSSTIWLFFFFRLNGQRTIKIDAWSLALNSVGLHFHEGIEKIKENDKNTKIDNLQNGRKSMGAKSRAYVYSSGKNLEKL